MLRCEDGFTGGSCSPPFGRAFGASLCYPMRHMDVLAQSSLLVAFTSFAFGLSTFAKNVRNKLYILYALGSVLVSAWALFFFMDVVHPGKGFYAWHLFANAGLGPVAVAFIQSMTRTERRPFSRALFLAGSAFWILASAALILGYQRVPEVRTLIYFAPTVILIQTLYLMAVDFMAVDRGMETVVGLRSRGLMYLGVLLVLGTSVMDHVPGLWVGIPIFGNIALTVLLYFISQAILQQRLMPVGTLLSRVLIMIAVALLLSSIYALLALWVREFKLYFLNSFIVSFVLLALLEPTRTLIRWVTLQLMAKQKRALRLRMQVTEKRVSQIVDPSKVVATLEDFLVDLIHPRRIGFYLQSSTTTVFRRMRESGPGGLPGELPSQHSLVEAMERLGEERHPATLLIGNLENESERLTGRDRKAMIETWIHSMRSLGVNLVVPLHSGGRLLGFILLDAESPPQAWGESWSVLKEIEPLIDMAAVALGRMEAFAQEREIERLATLGEMAAGLAHEIRNPLGAIKGAAQFLDPSLDRPESRFLRVIVEETDRLNRVVSQFLEYSKPHPAPRLSEVDLNALAQKTVTLLSRQAPEGVDLRFQSALLSPKAVADSEQLHQVLMNLVQNSYQALARDSRRNAKEVLVSVDALPHSEGRTLMISVEDRGPGIPKEILDKVFIPFFTTSPSGTGLGLPICQRIIQAHGGRIEIESQPGFRTVIRVILPRVEEREAV